MYLSAQVDVCGTEPVLDTRGLSAQLQLIGGASLHTAGSDSPGGNTSMTIERELHLLGLARQQGAVQW